jgi:hypothetical protein
VLISDGYNYSVTGPLISAELYNPSTDTFTLTGSQFTTNYLGTITLLGNADAMVTGSIYNADVPELYNPSSGTFANTSQLNTPRDLSTATLLPEGSLLVAGGHSNLTNTVLSSAELYSPTSLVPPNLTSISIAPASVPSLAVNGSQPLVATGLFSDESTQVLYSAIWTSSNPAVATITDDSTNSGVVFGVAAGTTTVSACAGTICGQVTVTVP